MTAFKNKALQTWERLDESWRFAIAAFILARLFYTLWSWVIFTIQPVAIQNFEFSGEPIVSIFQINGSQSYLYSRQVHGETLNFQPADRGHIVDQQTGSVWEISTGTALQGKYQGSMLAKTKSQVEEFFPYRGVKPYPGVGLAMWQRFDANWYVSVAENGYGTTPGDDHFPPLYPLLIRLFQPLFENAFLAGLFVSQAATLFSLKLLYDLFLQWGEKSRGQRAFLYFAIYPTFFFFFSAYSEPVFLAIALLALREMQHQRWAWAGFWTFCAITTRLQGAALLAPMLYFVWKDHQLLRRFDYWFGSFIAGFGGLFYLYLRSMQVGEGAVPFMEPAWHARLVPPWETYGYAVRTIFGENATFVDILNWAVMTLFIILLIWGWKKIPLEYNLFTALSIFIILIRIVDTQPLISVSRYSITLFPTFYIMSIAGGNPILRRVIIYGFILLHLYLSGQFFLWGWVA